MNNNPVLFYQKGREFYEFTNFFHLNPPLRVALPTVKSDGTIIENSDPSAVKNWKTSEHLFQAMKFKDRADIVERIVACPRPSDVFGLANSGNGIYKNDIRTDWFSISIPVMRWVLKKKFQDSKLKKTLVDTGNRYLVENAGIKDKFWGNGEDGNGSNGRVDKSKGQNKLGELLMELRTELQNETRWTPPTPPPTPPSTPPPTNSVPNDCKFLSDTKKNAFKSKIETELSNKGISTSDLSLQYQNWFNYISTKEWKVGELDNYENDLRKEIERVTNKKNQPNSPFTPTPPLPPKANSNYRDKWVQNLEKEFQELEFGNQHDTIVKGLSEIKGKIKDAKFDTEEKIENLGREFLDILKKFGKKKSASNPTKLTSEEKESLSNRLENLSQKMPEDLGKEEEKPVEISTIKKYFQANNDIKSITLEDNGELTIEFQDKTTQTTLANNEQLQQVKKYLQQKKRKSLNREKILNISQNSNHLPTKPNYLPRILAVGGLVILVIFFALIVFWQRKIRKSK